MAAYAKGLYLTITGRFAEAKSVIEAALPRNPNLAPLYAALAIVHTAEGAYDKPNRTSNRRCASVRATLSSACGN